MTTTSPNETLHFRRWKIPPDTAIRAVIAEEISKCGIYVLEFKNGEYYVGQSTTFFNRFSNHSRTWPDEITAVWFAPCPQETLDNAERDTVARLEADGKRLRNIDLVSLPIRSEALDIFVEEAVIEEWLSGKTDELIIDNRGKIALQRLKTKEKYNELVTHENFDAVVQTVSEYIRHCIPSPHKTEGSFWAISCMPDTLLSSTHRRLITLNINKVEMLILNETREKNTDPWRPSGFLNMALITELEINTIPESIGYIERTNNYKSVGEISRLWFNDYVQLQEALAITEVARAASKLAIGLLRKGPSLYSRFHDYNLADDIFRYLEVNGSE